MPFVFSKASFVAPVAALLLTHVAQAQQVVTLDYQTRAVTIENNGQSNSVDSGLRDGKPFSVRVDNVNTLVYRVQVTSKGLNFSSEMPDLFKPYLVGGEVAASTGGGALEPFLQAGAVGKVSRISDALGAISALGEQTQSLLLSVRTKEQAERARVSTSANLKATLEAVEAIINPGGGTGFNTLRNKNLRSPEVLSAIVRELLAELPSLREGLKPVAVPPSTSPPSGQNGQGMPAGNSGAGANQEKSAAQDRLQSLLDDQSEILTKTQQTTNLIQRALNKDYMFVQKGPFNVDADAHEITVIVTEIAEGGNAETMNFTVPNVSGSKLSYSAGFLSTGLVDFEYRTSPTGSDPETYRVTSVNSREFRVETGAFLHYGVRSVNDVNFAVTVGLAVKDNPIYAIGISAIQGRRQRFVITGGLAGTNVKRLAVGRDDLLSETTAPLRDVFMWRPFVGISYQF